MPRPGALYWNIALGPQATGAAAVNPSGGEEGGDEQPQWLQRRGAGEGEPPPEAPPEVAAVARAGGGRPLDAATRAYFEPRLRVPLEEVRVHTDPRANAAARSVRALAYTTGHDIVFREGQYDPASSQGRRLLAHELAHVVQQRSGAAIPSGVSRSNDPHEAEADRMAEAAMETRVVPEAHAARSPAVSSPEHASRAAGGGTSPRAIQRDPDPDPPEVILPTATGAGALREEAAALLREIVDAQGGDPARREAELRDATYLIVGNRLSWYRSNGTLIQAFPLAAGASTWAAGLYYRTPDDQIRRYVRLNGTPVWAPWVWSSARVGVIRNWLRSVDQPRFDAVIQGYGGAPVMIVLPLDPSAARRDSRAAQRLAEQVRARLAARRASAPSGGTTGQTTQQTGNAPPQTGETPPPTDTRTPQQRIGEPPDRVSVWSNEQGVYARVEVDRAATSIEIDDGESPEGLESRIQDAADDLRRSRDPASSVRMAHGATTTGFTGTSQTPPGQAPQGSQQVANAPAYPASIQNFGPEVTVPGAVTRFQMQLDYSSAGRDTLSQVAARMQHINYYWELLDVTRLSPEAQEEAGRSRAVGSGEQATHLRATGRDVSAEAERVGEDTSAELTELAQSRMPWQAKVAWLGVIGISNVVRMAGAPISSFITLLTQPLSEQRIDWSREGDFLVRCVATPAHQEGDVVVRASSVATSAVRVENIHHRAATVADRTEQDITRLEAQRAQATSDAQRADIDRQLQALRQSLTATTGELGASALRAVNQRLAAAVALRTAEEAHTPRAERTPEVRLLAVQLELQHINLADYIRSLETQKRELEARLSRTSTVVERMPQGNHHPRVVLVSEETGQVNDLIMVLGEAADSADGRRHYLLADVTIPNPRERYVYEGRSTQTGRAGHSEAVRQAFVDFRENNGYGRGTIAIRLPSTLEQVAGGPLTVERAMRSAPGSRARVMQRLRDLATAAEIAGLFLSGPAALAVGAIGGVAGAVVAIDSISRRRGGTDFRWLSFETIMDISSIVGGVAGVAGAGLMPLRNLPRWANRVERVQGMLHIFGVTQMGAQVIVIPVQLEMQLREIDANPNLSEGERAARRAEAFLQAVRSGIVTAVSAAQMADTSHGMESPRSAAEVAAGEHPTAPPERTGAAPERTGAAPERTGAAPEGAAATPERTGATPEGAAATPERTGATPEGTAATPEHPEGATPRTTSPRVAALEAVLGDLQGQVPVVENPNLRGHSTRVRYRDGAVTIEVGPGAGPAQIRSHLATARTLLRYQGPLGAVRRLLSRIVQVFTRIPGYGTRGFESRLEVRKLRQIIDSLQQAQARAEQNFETVGSREGGPTAGERAAIQRDIETLEAQLRYHEALVDSLDPGSGHVAAFASVTETLFAGRLPDLHSVEAAIATANPPFARAVATIDQVALLQSQGRVQGLETWLTETVRVAGTDRAALGRRIGELEHLVSLMNDYPPGTTARLDFSPAMGRFVTTPNTPGTIRPAPAPGSAVERHRNRFPDPPSQRAFDAWLAENFDAASRDPEPSLARMPDAAVDRQVQRYRERMAAAETRAARARGFADPLNPGLPNSTTRPSGVVVEYEHRQPDPHELTQADALAAATHEPIRVFGDDFPGIDGTIGSPPRPMQLKDVSGNTGGLVRARAADALRKATLAGSTGVEVHINAPAATLETVQAQWNDPDPFTHVPARAAFSGSTISEVHVWCSGGRHLRITMGPTGPVFTEL